jgi:predicted site-specific integrase-resolvase
MPRWRTLDDAAQQSGVSRRTLERWIGAGLLQRFVVRGDRRTYVDLDQIDKLREPRLKDPPPPAD